MRALIIIASLVLVLPLAGLAWLYTQLTADFVLDSVSEFIKEDGLEMSHDGPSTLGIFPNTFLEIGQMTIVMPKSEDSPEVSLDLTGLRFDASLPSLLSTPKGAITLQRLSINDTTLFDLASEVIVKDAVTLPNLSARLWQGALHGKVIIDSSTDKVTIRTEGRLDDADASEVLMSLAQLDLLTGALSVDWNLEIVPPVDDNRVAELTGNLNVSGEAITLNSIDLERSICNAVALAEGRRASSSISGNTMFSRFNATQTLAGTKVSIDELLLATSAMTISGSGVLDRASTAFTAQAVSNLDASKINERSNCQISSRISDIQWPVKCKGRTNTDNPGSWCQVDVSSIVEQTLKARIKDKLKLDDDSNLFQSLLKRIR